MSLFRRFTTWLIEKKKFEIDNYFLDISVRFVEENKEIVSKEEFQALLAVISPETGWKTFKSGRRLNQYRSWLSVCFRIAIETGLRIEEFMMMRFSHIHNNETGRPLYIDGSKLQGE